MPDIVQNPLRELSDALVERARRAQPLVARIEVEGRPMRSGTLWRKDVVIAAEQAFAHVEEAKVVLGDGSSYAARLAGRDPGTNVVALKLDGSPDPGPPAAAEPHPGALALAFGADGTGVSVRLGVIHSVGPAWHSRAGAVGTKGERERARMGLGRRKRAPIRSSVELEGNHVGAGIAAGQMRREASAVAEHDRGLFDMCDGLLRSDDDVCAPERSRTRRVSLHLDTCD